MTEPLLPSKIRLAISQSRGSALIVAGNIRSANPCGSRNYRRPRSRPSVAFVGAVVPAGACACRRAAPHTESRKPHRPQIVFERSQYFVVIPFSHGKRERSHGSARSSATKRTIDELSSREKRQVADELISRQAFFGWCSWRRSFCSRFCWVPPPLFPSPCGAALSTMPVQYPHSQKMAVSGRAGHW